MKIIIKGMTGSGKSYFFLPEVIKLLKPKRVFQIKTSIENHAVQNSPHWSPIKWEFYNEDILLNDEDLIFIDEPLYIENKKELELINKHNNVVISCQSEKELQNWIENLKDYLLIDARRYIEPMISQNPIIIGPSGGIRRRVELNWNALEFFIDFFNSKITSFEVINRLQINLENQKFVNQYLTISKVKFLQENKKENFVLQEFLDDLYLLVYKLKTFKA